MGRVEPSGPTDRQGRTDLRGGTERAVSVAPVLRVPLGGYQPLTPQGIREMGAETIAQHYERLSLEIGQSERLMEEMVVTRKRAEEDKRLLGWRRDMMRIQDFMKQRREFDADRRGMQLSLRQRQVQLAQEVGQALEAIQDREKDPSPTRAGRPTDDTGEPDRRPGESPVTRSTTRTASSRGRIARP